jgi:hypothetical protein
MLKTRFRVPNTVRGRRFISDLKRFASESTKITMRGRGPRPLISKRWAPRKYAASVSSAKATSFAVYLECC